MNILDAFEYLKRNPTLRVYYINSGYQTFFSVYDFSSYKFSLEELNQQWYIETEQVPLSKEDIKLAFSKISSSYIDLTPNLVDLFCKSLGFRS